VIFNKAKSQGSTTTASLEISKFENGQSKLFQVPLDFTQNLNSKSDTSSSSSSSNDQLKKSTSGSNSVDTTTNFKTTENS